MRHERDAELPHVPFGFGDDEQPMKISGARFERCAGAPRSDSMTIQGTKGTHRVTYNC